MTGPEQEQWLGPVRRDGRWWMVRADGDRVAYADDVRWYPGWPPGHLAPGPVRFLVVLLVALPFLVFGAGVVTGQICAIPECGYGELIAIQDPSSGDDLPVVFAAPCSREPVDRITVRGPAASGSPEGREVWRLVRKPGTGVVTRFPLGEQIAGYQEASGRSLDMLRQAYRAQLDTPQPAYTVTITYADGSADSTRLGGGPSNGALHLHTWGAETLEQFRADASSSSVCRPWIQDARPLLPLSLLGWPAVLLMLGVRAVLRGRFADALLRQAAEQVSQQTR